MKIVCSTGILLLFLISGQAQSVGTTQGVPDEAYERRLVRVLTGLQKNSWQGWKSGTTVVRHYLGNNDATVKPYVYWQPDLLFEVLQDGKLVTWTQVVNGKSYRQESVVKESKSEARLVRANDQSAVNLEIDGLKVASLLSELTLNIWDSHPVSSREWVLASNPALVLRTEFNGTTWEVAAVVTKKIGEREFECVKSVHKMTIYSDGPMEVITTQYQSPEVPGHLVEEVKEFYRLDKQGREQVPQTIIHQLVTTFKLA